MKKLLVLVLGLVFLNLPARERIKVTPETNFIELSGKTWLYRDSSTLMSIHEIRALPESVWKREDFDGFSQAHGWTRAFFLNDSDESFDKILYLNNPFLQEANVHFVVNDCLQHGKVLTGLGRPTSNKYYSDPMYPINIRFPPKSSVDVFIRSSDTFSTTNTPLFLLSEEESQKLKDFRYQISFSWAGLVLLSITLALFLYLHTKQKIFIYYTLLGIGSAIAISANIGVVLLFIKSDPYQLLNNYYELGGALMINFMPRFLNCIVPISTINRTLWKVVKWAGYLSFLVVFLYCLPLFKFNYRFSKFTIDFFVSLSSIIFIYLLIALAIAAFRKIHRAPSLFFVYLIYLGVAFGVILFPFVGINNKGLHTTYIMVAGSVFETVAFMFFMAQVTLGVYSDRDRLNKQVQSNQEAMMNTIVKGQEDERKRFAEDMHNGFSQMISSLNLNLKSLENTGSHQTNKRLDIFQTSKSILNDMYIELKSICFNLMPHTLVSAGIEEALKESANRISRNEELRVDVSVYNIDQRLPEVIEISLYRISQEWINNIIKHSDATKIQLQITGDKKEITLMIEDNGRGFDTSLLTSEKGNGWKSIYSRASLIKGEIELDSSPNMRGTSFILNTPIAKKIAVKKEDAVPAQ
ncbi:MAG: hypothetical protein JXR03_13710 [Cyclobacteriaceae bacterium]